MDTQVETQHNRASVPDQVIAIMKRPPDGGRPSVNPPGWNWLQSKFGRLKGTWVRFHIINANLGGPGNDTRNLVPTHHVVNHDTQWRNLEESAKRSAASTWTYVEAKISYDPDYPAGIPQGITAEWGNWDNERWVQQASVSLRQTNPKLDGQDGEYLDGSRVTKPLLEKMRLSQKQQKKGCEIIKKMWNSQDQFENEWEAEVVGKDGDAPYARPAWSALKRLFVDEDPALDPPYAVLIKTKGLERG